MPTIFNAANERAVAMFLAGSIGFTDIADLIGEAMKEVLPVDSPSVDEILEAETSAIAAVNEHAAKRADREK
jgi:1-deoxy-D-xylulose-5-phosphate reductoisomerase